MKQLIEDILGFMKNLNQMDLLLFFAILVLIILVVILIYIIKTSSLEEETIDCFNKQDIDLKDIVSNIENINSIANTDTIAFTSYEKDQEEKAIISYEELLEKNRTGSINYNEEEVLEDDISIKKIDLNYILNDNKKVDIQEKEQKNFKYINEEKFLETLKLLNRLLD